MNADNQSIAAILVVILATGYLVRGWWKNRQKSGSGCGGGGECACPSSKLSAKLKN